MVGSKKIALLAWGLALAVVACPKEGERTAVEKKAPAEVAIAQSQPMTPPAEAKPNAEETAGAARANEARGAGGVAAAESATEAGKKLYLGGCASCHGPDGTGALMRQMLPNIGDLTSAEMHARLSDEDIAMKIAKGKDKMPPFENVFKPEQIKQIVAYVRTLKKG
jgi:mono/diheme cytochrome c family protein